MPPSSNPARWQLTFFRQAPPPEDLPAPITRSFIPTASGPLELLSALPPSPSSLAPLLFIHGGFGRASEWTDLLLHFCHTRACYALSLRGHGHSWQPSYLRLVFGTTAHMMATDIAAGVAHVTALHSLSSKPRDSVDDNDSNSNISVSASAPASARTLPILLAHSNSGGLAQLALDRSLAHVSALVLLAGTPAAGGWRVYLNWLRADAWFLPRMYLRDGGHPRSPLSSTALVRRMFFSSAAPEAVVRACERGLAEWESLVWPLGLMGRFVRVELVLAACRGRVLVLAAEKDRLMGVLDMRRMAAEYGAAAGETGRVGWGLVEGSGHMLQMDVKWREVAERIEGWVGENVDRT